MKSKLDLLYDTGFEWAHRAESSSTLGDKVTYLSEAISSFQEALQAEPREQHRAVLQKELAKLQTDRDDAEKTLTQLPEADDKVAQAIQLDSPQGDRQKAKIAYLHAADLYLQALKKDPLHPSQKTRWTARANKVIKRIEELEINEKKQQQKLTPQTEEKRKNVAPRGEATVDEVLIIEDSKYSRDELKVLKESSWINGKLFPPWSEKDAGHESFRFSKPFTDPDGNLPLSVKQQRLLGAWRRAGAIVESLSADRPKIIVDVDPRNIVQEVVPDCSFVSSLCIAAHHEKSLGIPLVSNILYPQRKDGTPLYNPSGKYAVKLWYNGTARCVVVDDFFPVARDGRWLCSCSAIRNELWVSIIEKAYMKLNGGFDFPGSVSGIDLYALTGWIPEVYPFRNEGLGQGQLLAGRNETTPSSEETWEKLLSASGHGDVLLTVSTGEMTEQRSQALGLVPQHAYAVLAVSQVRDLKLIKLKNPWSRVCWRGSFSAYDVAKWTPELCAALQYDPIAAQTHDDGIFWIDFDSLLQVFNVMYMNWNPALFHSRIVVQRRWPHTLHGPVDDSFTVGENPQYCLTVNVPPNPANNNKAIIWILLTRHVVDKNQLLSMDKGDFLTLNVYDRKNGRRIYYPEQCMIKGIYSNNPHCLTAFQVEPGSHRYTLVVSLFEKTRSVNYTLTVYASKDCVNPKPTLLQLASTLPHTQELKGEWDADSAGGCPRFSSFFRNPQWHIRVGPQPVSELHLRLLAPKDFPVNLRIFPAASKNNNDARSRVDTADPQHELASSGAYRKGFCILELPPPIHTKNKQVQVLQPNAAYVVVVSTFQPGWHGPYFLHLETDAPVVPRLLPPEGYGMVQQSLHGYWISAVSASGCPNHGRYHENPTYRVTVPASYGPIKFAARLVYNPEGPQDQCQQWPSLNLSVFLAENSDQMRLPSSSSISESVLTSNDGVYLNPPTGAAISVSVLGPGTYLLVPSTFSPFPGAFSLYLYTSKHVSVQPGHHADELPPHQQVPGVAKHQVEDDNLLPPNPTRTYL